MYFSAGLINDPKLNRTVHRQNRYGFSGTACDQVIEQTCNRDNKTKGYYMYFLSTLRDRLTENINLCDRLNLHYIRQTTLLYLKSSSYDL